MISLMPNVAMANGRLAVDEEYFVQEDSASKFISAYSNGQLWEMTPDGKSKFVVNTGSTWHDIENYEGILYGVTYSGRLYENIDNRNRREIKNLHATVNSLVERDNKFYYVNNANRKLMAYDYKTGQIETVINNLGYQSAGDLIFHNGELYLASKWNGLVKIDLTNKKTTRIMNLPANTYGMSSLNGEIYALHGNQANQLDLKRKITKKIYNITNNGAIYGTGKGMVVISGNVLSNDGSGKTGLIDIRNISFGSKDYLRVSSKYGTLVIHKNGKFDYYLKNDLKEIQDLDEGQTIQDIFNYTTNFGSGNNDRANLIITIVGSSDKDRSKVLHLDTFDIDGNGLDSEKPSNNTITQWNDSAGHNNSASNGYGFVYNNKLINGHPGIDMSTRSVGYSISTHQELNDKFEEEKSFAFVFKTGNNLSGTQVIYEQGGSGRGYNLVINNSSLYAMVYNNGEWSHGHKYKRINMGQLDPNTLYKAYMVHDSKSNKFTAYLNKDEGNPTKMGELNNVDPQHDHGDPIGVGYVNGSTISPVDYSIIDSNSPFHGAFGEIISWNYALSQSEINGLNTRLNVKWKGIDSLPPNKPTINTTSTDTSVTFTLTDNGDQQNSDFVSGIDKLQYKIGNGTWNDYTSGDVITALDNQGKTTIYSKAIDKAGNESEEASVDVEIISERKITVKVTDGRGQVDQFVTSTNDKREDKILNPPKELRGNSHVDITSEIEEAHTLKYQILTQFPNTMPTNGWKSVVANGKNVEDDIILDKRGSLTHRGYIVHHLPNYGNRDSWSNENLVYKYPMGMIDYKDMGVSSSVSAYGSWKSIAPYRLDNGTTVNRIWDTNTAFLSKMGIGGDYKEASKFWGYIKVPTDGTYYFGIRSDDGNRGYITVNGETKTISNSFRPQYTYFTTTNQALELKANTYYPIHLEYFNWGGYAEFIMKYKKSPFRSNANSDSSYGVHGVPKDWFYPSKSTTPGQFAKGKFTGKAGIDIPKEAGSYYIAVKAEDSNQDSIKEIIYGPFEVKNYDSLNLEKTIKEINDSDYEITYKINPTQNPLIQNGTITNIRFNDEFPQGVTIISHENLNNSIVTNNSRTINGTLNNITYNGNNANPIEFKVTIRLSEGKEYTISERQKSMLMYREIDDYTNNQKEFPRLKVTGIASVTEVAITDSKGNSQTQIIKNGKFIAKVKLKLNKNLSKLKIDLSSTHMDKFNMESIKLTKDDIKYTGNCTIENSASNNSKTITFPDNLQKGEYICFIKVSVKDDNGGNGTKYKTKIENIKVDNQEWESVTKGSIELTINVVDEPDIL
jgi:VCBS repeat-containing protein